MRNLVGKARKGAAGRLLMLFLCIAFFCGTIGSAAASPVFAAGNEGLPEDDPNFIVVQKTFVGISQDQIPENFTIIVSNGGKTYELKEQPGDNIELTKSANGLVWRWKIMGAETGTYTIKEQNETVDNYNVKKDGEGTVTVKEANMEVTQIDRKTECSHTDWIVDEGKFFAAALTPDGTVVITEHALSAAQRETIKMKVLDGASGNWKTPVYFYSIDEQFESGKTFSLNGKTVTYKAGTADTPGKIELGNKKDWTHVLAGEYKIEDAQNPEIAITNTYTPQLTAVKVAKRVTGNMADISKPFSFEMKIENAYEGWNSKEPGAGDSYTVTKDDNGNTIYHFELKHEEDITIADIPLGAKLSIRETNAEGYAPIIVSCNGSKQIIQNEEWYVVSKVEPVLNLYVENQKNTTIDTGIHLDSRPYVLMLVLAVLGGAAVILRKRASRHND